MLTRAIQARSCPRGAVPFGTGRLPSPLRQARLLRFREDLGQLVGEAEPLVRRAAAASRSRRSVLCAKVDGRPRMLGRIEHHVAIGGIKRRLEKGAVDGFKKDCWERSLRFGIDECLAERMNHGADQEVAAQLDGVRLARLAATTVMPRERSAAMAALCDRLLRTSRHDPESAFFGNVGTAEYTGPRRN